MASIVPVVAKVGLQLLLDPGAPSVVTRAACTLVGLGLPIYQSFKTIERSQAEPASPEAAKETSQWLTYWTIYSALSAVESVAASFLHWVPLYRHVKLLFLLWLQLPSFQGARRLYREVLRPFLLKHQNRLDAELSAIHSLLMPPELKHLLHQFRQSLASVPVLAWFLKSPDAGDAQGSTE